MLTGQGEGGPKVGRFGEKRKRKREGQLGFGSDLVFFFQIEKFPFNRIEKRRKIDKTNNKILVV